MTVSVQPEINLTRYGVLDTLPASYRLERRIELNSRDLLIWLNVAAFALMVAGFLLMSGVASLLDELRLPRGVNPLEGITPLGMAVLLFVLVIVMLIVHELFHGLAFQSFGIKPRYGVNLAKGVAYASGEKYYVARDAYQIIGLAPLVGITLMAIIAMIFTSAETRTVIAMVAAANIGGSVGDIWFIRVIRRYPPHLLVRDFGEGAELFMPA